MKKIITVLLVLSLAFSVLTVSAQGEELKYDYIGATVISYDNNGCVSAELLEIQPMMLSDYSDDSVYVHIYNALKNFDAEIDLEDYEIKIENLEPVFNKFYHDNPELFYIINGYSGGTAYNGYVKKVFPIYTCTKEEAEIKTKELNKMIDAVLSDCPDGTDLEKVLYIHDYLVSNGEYDLTYSKRDVYTFLKYGTGVCEGYSQTFQLFMNKLGIEAYQVSSEALDHIWNVVNIDGEFYHLDATWDDPTYDRLGMASHKYFLLSEEALISRSLEDEESASRDDMVFVNSKYINCNSQKYESGYAWVDDEYPIIKYENGWLALTRGANSIYDIHFYNNGLKEEEFKISVPNSFFTPGVFYPLSGMFRIGRNVYGNTNTALWCLEHNGSGYELKSLTIPGMDISAGERIYGSRYDHNGHIVVNYGTSLDDATLHYIDTPCLTNENFSWANAMVDIRRIILNINQKDMNELLMDINGDHIIDIRDLIGIKERAVA